MQRTQSWRPVIDLDIPYERWEKTGPEEDPDGRLLTCIQICGLPLHLEAWAITKDKEHMQCSAVFPDDFVNFYAVSMCNFQTTEINNREYAIVALPFGD